MCKLSTAAVARSLSTYGGTLAGAGGHELEALLRGDDGAAPAVAIYACPPYDMEVPALGVARLSINLTPSRVSGGLDGGPTRGFEARRHSLFLTPAGASARWRKERPSRHINIYFDDRERPMAPLLNATLPGIAGLLEMLADELAAADAFAAEAADSLVRLLLVRLARHGARVPAANPVTPALLARLREHVRAHLDTRLLVADLAAVAGLPPNRFAQAFTAAGGCSPHQFVIAQRLQRAQELLRGGRLSPADVAAACGFASQQHLTQLMRRRLGTTPGRLRGGDGRVQ